ncbi:GDP-mannose 4,6-dehydratase [Undibacterium sp.]|uniref:GDP-mannose 4,6-dehydratase n=1 Tax=Undibacterium sp. TaxID=1914977 RepID=UPI0037534FC6
MNKSAVITGIGGQDAYYLSSRLLNDGIHVIGTTRNLNRQFEVQEFSGDSNVTIVEWNLLDQLRFAEIIKRFEPAFVFNLAAKSSGAEMNKHITDVSMVNGSAVLGMLETLREISPLTRFIQASSAEVFGNATTSPQTELSCRSPRSAYGIAKVFADSFVKLYREEFGMLCGSAILYNHESPRRESSFVTRKITSAAAAIFVGSPERLLLGNLGAMRDWGHARDYADGMWRIAQADQIEDYIFATGTTHTVREFVELAFRYVGTTLDWLGDGLNEIGVCRQTGDIRVAVAEEYFRPLEAEPLIGNPAKAKDKLGWEPTTPFESLVSEMIDADLKKLSVDLTQKKPN